MQLYEVLNVSRDAKAEEITKAYRLLALKYHPDRNAEGAQRFKEVCHAYTILTDPERRRIYDVTGSEHEPGESEVSLSERSKEMEKLVRDFYHSYVNSIEERNDFIAGYKSCGGDFVELITSYLLFDNGRAGEVERLFHLGEALLKEGTLKKTERWVQSSTPAARAKVAKQLRRERRVAEKRLRELGLEAEEGEEAAGLGALQALMQKRAASEHAALLDQLEQKYVRPQDASKPRKKGSVRPGGKGKGGAPRSSVVRRGIRSTK